MATTKKTRSKPRPKRKGATRRQTKKKTDSNWQMLVAGLSIGLFIAFLTWLQNSGTSSPSSPEPTARPPVPAQAPRPVPTTRTQVPAQVSRPAPVQPVIAAPRVQAQKPPAAAQPRVEIIPLPVIKKPEPPKKHVISQPQAPRFDFYENLPRQTVDAPINNYNIKKKQAPLLQIPTTTKPGKGQYILQAGSFRKHRDAERRIAQLALIGVEARIEKIKAENNYWHRIRIGPFSSINEATRVSTQLHSHSIQTMLVNTGK